MSERARLGLHVGRVAPSCPEHKSRPMPPTQVRIEPEVADIVAFLAGSETSPKFKDRPAVFIVNELLKESPSFKQALAQKTSERHPRPLRR